MNKQELTVICTFSKEGENIEEIIRRSFEHYLRRILDSESKIVVS